MKLTRRGKVTIAIGVMVSVVGIASLTADALSYSVLENEKNSLEIKEIGDLENINISEAEKNNLEKEKNNNLVSQKEIETEKVSSEDNKKSLGIFKITVYDDCKECSDEWGIKLARPCSNNHRARENHTVAVDPSIIPYGTKLLIDGIEYVAEDCGSAVKGNVIDVYVKDCENSFGRKYSEVFIIE